MCLNQRPGLCRLTAFAMGGRFTLFVPKAISQSTEFLSPLVMRRGSVRAHLQLPLNCKLRQVRMERTCEGSRILSGGYSFILISNSDFLSRCLRLRVGDALRLHKDTIFAIVETMKQIYHYNEYFFAVFYWEPAHALVGFISAILTTPKTLHVSK